MRAVFLLCGCASSAGSGTGGTVQINREVALTEVWLDQQARLAGPSLPTVRAKRGFAAILGLLGTVFAVVWYLGPKFI